MLKNLLYNLLIIFCVSIYISAQKIPADKNPLARFEKSIDDGKFAETERDLFNYVIANPNDAKGFSLLAKMRLKQNRLNEAKSLANKALMLAPNLLSAKMNLALINFQLGEVEQARIVLGGVSESEISDNSIRLNLAQTFALVGDCAKALSAAEKLPTKIKNSEALPLRADCYLQTGDQKNFALLIPFAKISAKQNPPTALKFAEVLSRAAMHQETADLLRPVVAAAPKNADALLLLAKSEIYLKDFANAKIHLAQAEKIQPASAQIYFVKSFLESEQGNTTQALDLLEKSLTIEPNNAEILASYVIAAIRANQAGKAVRAAEKLSNIQPENPEFLYLYGAASLQNNNLQKAETSLTKFLEMRPNDPRGCLALGLTFAAQPDKLPEARRQMQNCLTINPNNFEATYQLGLSYKTQGDNAKAVEYLEETVRLSPDYASALRDLGAVYLLSSQEAKARPVLERAVLLNPNDADTHFQLSRLYNLIGETALAKKHLEIFQKLKNPKKEGM
ncbi:MAG: tetratricopeptide repeat protein [Acidobacteriota bacterium]|nr:tetratricopeptide repeat protein [Acidobacteriota bacterium]